VDLWREAKAASDIPEASKLAQTLPLVNYRDLMLEPSGKAAMLRKKGQSIDLGGIGKGYAAEKVLEVLRGYGIASAFTNFGGNVAAIGAKPDGAPWKIGIQHPRQENKLAGVLSIKDSSVVTSGDYQRFYIGKDGRRYHHILNPVTGYPSESGLISATVVTGNSMAADALSTMLFVSGLSKSIMLLKIFPEAEAILIDKDLQVYITGGLKENFQAAENINLRVLD
jgi:thiamine biosynthesis lipoprotein